MTMTAAPPTISTVASVCAVLGTMVITPSSRPMDCGRDSASKGSVGGGAGKVRDPRAQAPAQHFIGHLQPGLAWATSMARSTTPYWPRKAAASYLSPPKKYTMQIFAEGSGREEGHG